MNVIHSAWAALGGRRGFFSLARAVVYWGLPPVLIYLIVRKIDLGEVGKVLVTANPWFVGMGVLLMLLVVTTAGLRWWWLVRRLDVGLLPVTLGLVGYSRSLAMGVTAPGSIGADAFRILMAGRVRGRYWRSAFAILIEKFSAVLTYGALVALLLPVLPENTLPAAVEGVIHGLSLLLIILVLGLGLMAGLERRVWMRKMVRAFEARIGLWVRRIAKVRSKAPGEGGEPEEEHSVQVAALWSPSVLVPAVILSLVIQLLTTFQAQLYFAALNVEVSFVANLFVNQILFFLFLLPISFAGIGVREGAYILLYGAFGVPEETALLAALCSFMGVLFSYSVGACLFLLRVPVLTVAPGGRSQAGRHEQCAVAASAPRVSK